MSYYTALVFTISFYTNTTGNGIDGWTINIFYSATAQYFPVFQCALNDGDLEPCMSIIKELYEVACKLLKYLGTNPPPMVYGPLSYGNHTVTVQARSTITLQITAITHQGKSLLHTFNNC